jgi:hypothetical protein
MNTRLRIPLLEPLFVILAGAGMDVAVANLDKPVGFG